MLPPSFYEVYYIIAVGENFAEWPPLDPAVSLCFAISGFMSWVCLT